MSDDARREAALSTMRERFPAVSEKIQQVYGLRLPRHLAVFCALWHSADEAEQEAFDYLGMSLFGLTEYFADDGLRLVGRDGLDERLHGRFRCDPAEFVTVLAGGTDGLHYGLWYDDPAQLPSFVVHNYARDSAETWTNGCPTLLAELRHVVDRVHKDYGADDEEGQLLEPLAAALDWFAPAEREALAADGEPRWAAVDRPMGGVSVFPALPDGSGDPRLAGSHERLDRFRAGSPDAAAWIAQARQEPAARLPPAAVRPATV